MPDTAIDSVGTFIAEMAKLQQIGDELRPVFWFRGHAKVCWKLLPGVLRDDFVNRANEFNVRPNDPRILDTAIETTEKLINDQFRREGASLLQSQANPVDVYFLAQHYGLPTRLLDWTANPLAALFFAVSQEHDHDGDVISILPDWRLTFGDESNPRKAGLPYPPVGQRDQLVVKTIEYLFDLGQRPEGCLIVPLQPDLWSARLLQQGACFTMHMPGCPAINENPTNSKRFRIPSSSKRVLLEELRAVGVNWATLFPDLDHLAKEIREDWKLGAPRRV